MLREDAIEGRRQMSVTYVIGFEVKPGERDRFLDLLGGVLDAMRHEANFENATLHADPADPSRFLLHETWADHQDVLDVQIHRPYRTAWHAALPELLVTPRDISMWQPLRRDVAKDVR
jgi:quinol monooxygenase YgiN